LWLKKIKLYDPEGFDDLVKDWLSHEEDARFWREFEKEKMSSKLSGKSGWSEMPTLIVPRMLSSQMERRFGPAWGSFNFIRYCVWTFYPKLRPTYKYHGKKKGIDKLVVGEDFNKTASEKKPVKKSKKEK
jgi:hypothetical protein